MQLSQVVDVKKRVWLRIGGNLVRLIIRDAERGKSQDKKSKSFPSYTNAYARFKGVGKFGPNSKHFGESKDTQVSPPNLRLTGSRFKSFATDKSASNENRAVLTFREGDKVIFNANRGRYTRNVHGVNDKNLDIAADMLSDAHGKNIDKWAEKDINIII